MADEPKVTIVHCKGLAFVEDTKEGVFCLAAELSIGGNAFAVTTASVSDDMLAHVRAVITAGEFAANNLGLTVVSNTKVDNMEQALAVAAQIGKKPS
jgi:hypothetical protein